MPTRPPPGATVGTGGATRRAETASVDPRSRQGPAHGDAPPQALGLAPAVEQAQTTLATVGLHALARRIEESRQQYGDFRDVNDLRRVSGIGPATLERLRPFVYAQPLSTADNEEDAPSTMPEPAVRREPPPAKQEPAKRPVAGKKGDARTEPVDLNRATAEELQRLPGVGPALSERILAAREQKPFRGVEDLRRVRGIGPKTLERLRPHVAIGAKEDRKARGEDDAVQAAP